MPFEINETPLPGAYLVKPRIHSDARGHFLETYNEKELSNQGINIKFVQDNQSASQKHVLRGFHFQAPPHAQAKLVRVARGSALDIIADLRKNSPTFGKTYAVKLTGENFLQLLVPVGFGHAFLTLEDNTLFQYKCSRLYNRDSEGGIHWNDPDLNAGWGINNPLVSDKDAKLPYLRDFKTPFTYG